MHVGGLQLFVPREGQSSSELAEEIIDGVDLPDIIREASTSVTADVMTDVRSTSERADDAVANAVNRFLRRRGAAAIEAAPDEEGPR